MDLQMTRSFFFWCTLINYGLLAFWALLFLLGRSGWLEPWTRFFHVTAEQFNLLNLAGITLYKMGIFLFNLVPWIALYLIG
jgi:hypothetical protein